MGQHHVRTAQMNARRLPPVPRQTGTAEMAALCGKVLPSGACLLRPGHTGRCLPRLTGKHRPDVGRNG